MATKFFTATKAFLNRGGKILILRESNQYQDGSNTAQYDVPGGRIEPEEELLSALKREVFEESGLTLFGATPFYESTVQIQRGDDIWEIHRIYFACKAEDGDVVLSNDHDEYQWIDPADYKTSNIIPDLGDVFDAYLARN
jgi:8-oxo-dGTP diphosphatase